MKKQVDIETLEIITSFVAEGYERLDDAEAQLESAGSGDPDCLNSVFRLFHSVKGSAGYLCFDNIKLLTHEAEALLEVCIKEKAPVTPEALDLIYQTIDALRSMISLVEKDNCDDDANRLSAERTAAIKEFIPLLRSLAPGGSPPSAQPAQPSPASIESGGASSSPAELQPAAAESPAPPAAAEAPQENPRPVPGDNRILLSELVTADMVERFLGECADLVDEVERKALSFPAAADGFEAVNEVFRAIHTIKGNAGFFGHSLLERTCMETEGLLDRARKAEIPINEALTNLLIARIDLIRSVMAGVTLVPAGEAPAASASTPPSTQAPGKKEKAAAAPESPVETADACLADEEYRPIGEILVDMGAVKEEDLMQALSAQERPIGEILVDSGAARPEDVAKALGIQQTKAPPGVEAGGDRSAVEEIQRKEIRVDTAKLDKLFELVGELITAEAMVGNCPDLAGLKLDSFQKSFAGLNKISREIQETAMMIRMIPLDGLFHKMTRLVRDLSRKFGKPVNLLVSGQDTEMDKNVIDQISDPLVHILRNAIDHGLESPEARAAAGKPEAGVVKLHAKYEGSEIWISVSDDGAGLNREKIVAKALQNGMISGDPALIPDAEIWKLIFEPGFSTADKVSEVSGRGVGMDVVKKNLERIRGRVDIRTEKGQGTEFILKIPLTMAIIDGITVRCGRNFYSLPLGDILEFFKVSEGQLTVAERGEEAVSLRGSVLPLIKLAEVFRIEGAAEDPCQGIVIVVRSAGKVACVLIDEVVGNQQIVVKSLSEYLGKVDGISGCSILGNGNVSFIIDTGKLIALRLD